MFTQDNMVNITLSIPEELKKKIQERDEVNWSAVIRNSLQEHLRKIEIMEAISKKSKLNEKDAKEISEMINSSVAKKLNLK